MRIVALVIAAAVLALVLASCGGGDGNEADRQQAPAAEPGTARDELQVDVAATGLEVPWDLAFLPGDRALVTERDGSIRLFDIQEGVEEEPVAEVDVDPAGEGGLLGIALDPEFADGNRFAYLVASRPDGVEVQRWSVGEDLEMEREAVILEGIRSAPIHDGGRLRFSPDGHLYVPTGDAGEPALAQVEDSLNGKILRLGPEEYRGDSPAEAEIVSLGHRNPQGLDWHPDSGELYATEHGATRNDEINRIRFGENYGWPEVEGEDHGGFTAPLRVYTDMTLAPSGAAFVTRNGSTWTRDFVVAGLAGEQLRRLTIRGDRVTEEEAVLESEYGRLRAVVQGPDGALYVTTSNRDGRGEPTGDDDRILRIVPPGA
jgi:glucose/arabinose dehydrogenase